MKEHVSTFLLLAVFSSTFYQTPEVVLLHCLNRNLKILTNFHHWVSVTHWHLWHPDPELTEVLGQSCVLWTL
jgi:hypothetical protein